MTAKARKRMQIPSEFRSRAGGRGRDHPRTEWRSQLKLCDRGIVLRELSPSQEPFPSMAGFPITGRTAAAALGPLRPSTGRRLCAPWGFPGHRFTADSITKGRGTGRLELPEHGLEMWTKGFGGSGISLPTVLHNEAKGPVCYQSPPVPAEPCQGKDKGRGATVPHRCVTQTEASAAPSCARGCWANWTGTEGSWWQLDNKSGLFGFWKWGIENIFAFLFTSNYDGAL